MIEEKKETISIPGKWPLDQFGWKTEQKKLMGKFLENLKSKRILGLKCPKCGLVYTPPKPFCRCLGRPEEWVEVSDKGTVTTFVLTGEWAFRGFDEEAPKEKRTIVGVNFDGSDTVCLAALMGVNPEDVDVGIRVKVKWPEKPEGALKDILFVELER